MLWARSARSSPKTGSPPVPASRPAPEEAESGTGAELILPFLASLISQPRVASVQINQSVGCSTEGSTGPQRLDCYFRSEARRLLQEPQHRGSLEMRLKRGGACTPVVLSHEARWDWCAWDLSRRRYRRKPSNRGNIRDRSNVHLREVRKATKQIPSLFPGTEVWTRLEGGSCGGSSHHKYSSHAPATWPIAT